MVSKCHIIRCHIIREELYRNLLHFRPQSCLVRPDCLPVAVLAHVLVVADGVVGLQREVDRSERGGHAQLSGWQFNRLKIAHNIVHKGSEKES